MIFGPGEFKILKEPQDIHLVVVAPDWYKNITVQIAGVVEQSFKLLGGKLSNPHFDEMNLTDCADCENTDCPFRGMGD
jgi:hypothetical protein